MTQPVGFQKEREQFSIYLESLEAFSRISVPIGAALAPAVATLRSMLDSGMPRNKAELKTLAQLLPTFSNTGYLASEIEEEQIERIQTFYRGKLNDAAAGHRPFPRSLAGRGGLSGKPAAK